MSFDPLLIGRLATAANQFWRTALERGDHNKQKAATLSSTSLAHSIVFRLHRKRV